MRIEEYWDNLPPARPQPVEGQDRLTYYWWPRPSKIRDPYYRMYTVAWLFWHLLLAAMILAGIIVFAWYRGTFLPDHQ